MAEIAEILKPCFIAAPYQGAQNLLFLSFLRDLNYYSARLILLNHYLTASMDIQAFRGGLGVEAGATQRIPGTVTLNIEH